jgi:hypothetical protein
MLLAAVGVTVLPVTVPLLILVPMGAVGLHAGGVEAGLGGVRVGVVALPIVTVLASVGVRVAVAPVRVTAFAIAPAGRERNGQHASCASGSGRRASGT